MPKKKYKKSCPRCSGRCSRQAKMCRGCWKKQCRRGRMNRAVLRRTKRKKLNNLLAARGRRGKGRK